MSQTTPQQAPERKLNLGRLERLQRLLQYGAALVLVVFLVLIGLALFELRDLNARKEKTRRELTETTRALADVNSQLELKKKALDATQSVNTVLSGVADAYKEEHPDKAELVTDAVRNAVEASIAGTPAQGGQQSGGTTEAAAKVPPRVYIQIMHAGQKARAADVARRLQSKGFLVPSIENMERRGNRQTYSDMRFDPADEMAAADTQNIRAVLGDFGVKLRETKLPDVKSPRQYELWLGDDFFDPAASPRPDTRAPVVTRPTRSDVTATPEPKQKPPAYQKTPERNDPYRKSP